MSRVVAILLLAAVLAPTTGAWATEDRYGPAPATRPNGPPMPVGMLIWPGKTAPQPSSSPEAAPAPSISPQISTASPDRAALPTNLYSPPPPPTPMRAASAQPALYGAPGLAPRRYSVDREFGLQPDPIPLSPQFLADSPTTDLAAPPPPLPPQAVNSSMTPANRARALALQDAQTGENN